MTNSISADSETKILVKEVERAQRERGKVPAILQEDFRFRKTNESLPPKISVIAVGFNNAPYLRDTIHSVLNQSYDRFELIVIDGGSTDETVSILKGYPQIRWVSEKDCGSLEALRKGLAMCRGQYVASCYVTDGYLDRDWLKKCAEKLDSDPEVSLIWGLPQYLLEGGTLGEISHQQFHQTLPPQKENFIYYWLVTKFSLPEGNLCLRKNVFDRCLEKNLESTENYWLEMNYRFNSGGYLPYFLPAVANFGRIHPNSAGHNKEVLELLHKGVASYRKKSEKYRKNIEKQRISHRFIDPAGNLLPYSFSSDRYKMEKAAHRRKFSYLVKALIKRALPTTVKKFIQRHLTKSIS